MTLILKLKSVWSILIMGFFLHWTPFQEPVRILAVGDSITQGGKRDRPEYTYRLPLQMLLLKNGLAFDFIGSRQKGLHEDAEWPDLNQDTPFDPDHEGYYGNKTRDVVRKVREAFADYQAVPDIVLVHLGTNDQKHGDFETNVGQPLREFIAFLRQTNPEVIVLLGHLNFNGGEPALAIRQVVESVANELDQPESPVKTVHHYQGWIEQPDKVYTDTFDWAHPNLKGQEKMAFNWYAAMKTYLK
ncbi:MAG: SGNH/GDSL hydrolase family protein [Candidatus Cyclobacteriaceae bacterium M3_2C_046]